jgi:amidase
MADTHTLDLEAASATALAAAIADKRISAKESVEAAIERIEKRNPALNAVIVKDYERARKAAAAADARIAKGERAPLLGVPMTVKESHNVAGLPTTWGLEAGRNFIASEDSVCVTRLKNAGAVILGKTNVPPSLADWQSANPIYGRTNNPYDLTRSPGGSSGGAAAALAAGMIPLEFGSDIGGSIRIPAHFCGVFGHKPSYGLLPMRGHAPPGLDGADSPLSVVGPLARTADDLALALEVLAGPDRDEATGYKLALPPPRHRELGGYRALVVDQHPSARTDSEIRAALRGAGEEIARAGGKVFFESALLPDLAAAHSTYMASLLTVTTRGAPNPSEVISAHRWLELADLRAKLRRQWRALFDEFDVVLTPPFGTAAFPHTDEPNWRSRTLIIDGAETPYGNQLAWPGLATLPGLPATIAPIGTTKAGLPIGVQVVSAFLEDRNSIAVAGLLSRA